MERAICLVSGFCLAASSWGYAIEERLSGGLGEEWRVTPRVAGTFASLVAWQRCYVKTRDGSGMKRAVELIKLIRDGCLSYQIPWRTSMLPKNKTLAQMKSR